MLLSIACAATDAEYQTRIILDDNGSKLTHSWGFALREGVFAETKEGICRNKD